VNHLYIGNTYRFNVSDVSHALTNKEKESEPANKWEQHFEEPTDIVADIDLDDDI